MGADRLESNLQKLELASSLLSSSDDCRLKVVENKATEGGATGGNMRAQFLGKVSTVA